MGEQRIPNVPEEAWTPEVQATFPIMLPAGSSAKGSDFNSILVMANHPELSELWLRFNAGVSRGFDLSARHREIAILRVAWRKQSEYEWVHHTISAVRIGLTIPEMVALQSSEPATTFHGSDLAVILAVDDICLAGSVSATTWPIVSEELCHRAIMELLFAISCYVGLAAILNSVRVEVEPPIVAFARDSGLPALERKCVAA